MKKHWKLTAALLTVLCIGGLMSGCSKAKNEGEQVHAPLETAIYGVMAGSTAETFVIKNYPDAKINAYESISDAILALDTSKLDYVLTPYTTAYNAIRSNKTLEIYKDNVMPDTSAIAVSKKNPELLKKLNTVLEKFSKEGTLKKIAANWTTLNGEYVIEDIPVAAGTNGTLRVAVSADREPVCFVSENNKYTGLDCELIERIAYELDMKVEYQNMQFSGLIVALASGKADLIISNMTPTKERKESVDFTMSYFDNPQVLVVKKQSKSKGISQNYTEIEQLDGKKIASLTGSVFDQYVAPFVPNAEFLFFNGIADMLTAVKSGKAEAVPLDEPVARLAVSQNADLTILPQVVAQHEYALTLAKDSPLTEQFSEIIKDLREDGTLDEMTARWTGNDESAKVLPTLENSGENGTLKVICFTGSEPMCYMGEGKVIGYEVELCMRIGQIIGKKTEFVSVDFSGMFPMLETGKADVGIGCIIVTDERKEMVDMPDPHYKGGLVLVVRKAAQASTETLEFNTIEEMSNQTFFALTGATIDMLVRQVVDNPHFLYFNSTSDGLAALKTGKVDGSPADEPVAKLILAKNPELGCIPQLITDDLYGIAMQKNSPITKDVNDAIAAMWKDGTLDELKAKWTGADDSVKVLPQFENTGKNGVLNVACYAGLEPMCYVVDGNITGFDIELSMLIGERLNKKVEITNVDFNAMIPMLQSGKTDIALGCMSITDERKETVDMSDPYYIGGVVMLVRKLNWSAPSEGGFFGELKASFTRTFITENRWKLILEGLGITVLLSVFSGVLGSLLGFGICMLRRGKSRLMSMPAAVFIRIIQGTPIVVLLMIFYYVIFGSIDIPATIVAILGFSINFGVYVSEMMRTGIEAVDKGQIEASYALGLNKVQTFFKITFPQAARHFLPVFKGEFISMVKMTSVVGYIAIQDLTKVSDIIRSRTLEAFFPLIATACMYFVVANIMTMILSRIEIRLDPKRRKRVVKGVEIK